MAPIKELRGGGEERKETLADKPWDFENRPLGLSCQGTRVCEPKIYFFVKNAVAICEIC